MPAAPYPYIEITRGGFFAIHNLDDKLLEEVTIMLEERISTIEEEIRCHQLTELQHSIHLSTPHSMDSTIYQVRLNSLTQRKVALAYLLQEARAAAL